MKYQVHIKNELGHDDTIDVEAGSELEAERAAAAGPRGGDIAAVIGAYPAEPWQASSTEELARNYAEHRSDDVSWERVDLAATEDWASHTGNLDNGDRAWPHSEFFYRDGAIWNDGAGLGPNGESQPYPMSFGWGGDQRQHEDGLGR